LDSAAKSRSKSHAAMTQPSTDEENWHKVYAHAFLPNISVLPEVREGSSV